MALSPNQYDALDRISGRTELESLFLNEAKGLFWFDELKQRGYFKPELNPIPVESEEKGYFQIPSWPAAEYLSSSSLELSTQQGTEKAQQYLEVIRQVSRYSIDHKLSNNRTWWQFAKVLRNLPCQLIEISDVEFIKYWLADQFDCSLLLEEIAGWILLLLEHNSQHTKEIVLELLQAIFQIEYRHKKYGDKGKLEAYFPYRTYSLKKFVESICNKAGSSLGITAVTLFKEKYEEVLIQQNNDSYSTIWRPAIEEHEQNNRSEDADDLLLISLRDSLLGFCSANNDEAEPFVTEMLESDFIIIKRIAINSLDSSFELFSEALESTALDCKFFSSEYQHELWHLLNHHFGKFSSEQQNHVFSVIEGIVLDDEDKEISVKATAYKKSIWLSAIKEQNVQAFEMYQQCIQLIGQEPEHSDFSSYTSVGWGGHKSPISIEEMRSMSLDDLILVLNNFQNPRGFDEPDLEGLTKQFKGFVQIEAKKISLVLEQFLPLRLPFIYELIEAYAELWRENSTPELPWSEIWQNLLNFIEKLITEQAFWNSSDNSPDGAFVGNRHWIVGAIGRLIEGGCKSDKHAFDIDNVGSAKRVLEITLNNQTGEAFSTESDAVSIAINSPRGRCLEALINLALFSCRQARKRNESHDNAWKMYETSFDNELLKRDEDEFEFATLVANYLANFQYLSNKWVVNNLPIIFNQNNYQGWLCAMQGYSFLGQLQPDVYKYLKINGDFVKALDDPNLKERVHERFIQLIMAAYLSEKEPLDGENSLINELLIRKQFDELHQIVWFGWTQRENNNEQLNTKIYELWPHLLELIDVTKKEGEKLASQLCLWSCFIDVLDKERKQWLLQIAPYSEVDHNSNFLLSRLAKLSSDYPFESHEIWMEMLTLSLYDYPEDAIKEIFTNLILKGHEGIKKAKEVSDAYLKHGYIRPMEWLGQVQSDNQDI